MGEKIETNEKFQTVTYEFGDGEYEAVITDLKRKISVNGYGTTELEAYSNALQRLDEEE